MPDRANADLAILRSSADRSRALNWIQVGSIAGQTVELASVALRSANFRLRGDRQRAVSARACLAELAPVIDSRRRVWQRRPRRHRPLGALADIETAWTAPEVPGAAHRPGALTRPSRHHMALRSPDQLSAKHARPGS
jgi:hypothetical protein